MADLLRVRRLCSAREARILLEVSLVEGLPCRPEVSSQLETLVVRDLVLRAQLGERLSASIAGELEVVRVPSLLSDPVLDELFQSVDGVGIGRKHAGFRCPTRIGALVLLRESFTDDLPAVERACRAPGRVDGVHVVVSVIDPVLWNRFVNTTRAEASSVVSPWTDPLLPVLELRPSTNHLCPHVASRRDELVVSRVFDFLQVGDRSCSTDVGVVGCEKANYPFVKRESSFPIFRCETRLEVGRLWGTVGNDPLGWRLDFGLIHVPEGASHVPIVGLLVSLVTGVVPAGELVCICKHFANVAEL